MNKAISVFAVLLALSASAAKDTWWSVTGRVDKASVVAVSLSPWLYTAAGDGALNAKLRIRDQQGTNVPFVIRRRQVRKVVTDDAWTSLRVVSVSDANGKLRVEAEWPNGIPAPAKFSRLRVNTPLVDFEQTVEVQSGTRRIASGTLCDYGRYADFRRTEIPFAVPFAKRLTFTFARPVSTVESAEFERMIQTRGKGSVDAANIRRTVKERPFRINAITVATPRSHTMFQSVAASECAVAAQRKEEGSRTVFDFDAHGIPFTGLFLRTEGANYSRLVRLQARAERGWRDLAQGKVRVVDLPGDRSSQRELSFGREIRERRLRVVVENGDNHPLAFDAPPLVLKTVDYDAAFIAEPGMTYEIGVLADGAVPHYDDVVLNHIDKVGDPARFRIVLPTAEDLPTLAGEDAPAEIWLFDRDGVMLLVSLVVFGILFVVCWKMLVRK